MEEQKISAEAAAAAAEKINQVIANVETVIIGKRQSVELVLLALLAKGHVLLEDVPGVGKTSLVSAIARSVDCGFKRIQFTPDLMPSDVTGFSVYNQKTGEFEFRPGAVMSNLVLADETNRASAKTQAALLEAMEEKQVTVDSTTYTLDEPFMVMATQNPLESFGTYPLPEAQIDRFLIKIAMGYPTVEEERTIIHNGSKAKKELKSVITKEEVLQLRELAEAVFISEELERYIVQIVSATRSHAKVLLGSSPRGSIALNASAKVLALFRGRGYVIPDDVKYMAPFVLGHRLILSHEAKTQRISPQQIIEEVLSSVAVPE
ncbi:MAG: MoxR family ATPase [Oscillospiraceae bacterium]|nr:MoxR family ATPase [Oscillospiraceae bacterium]